MSADILRPVFGLSGDDQEVLRERIDRYEESTGVSLESGPSAEVVDLFSSTMEMREGESENAFILRAIEATFREVKAGIGLKARRTELPDGAVS